MTHTLDDLQTARERLAALELSDENYIGNNPDKFTTRIREARDRARSIEKELLESGALEPTELQAANMALDKQYPYAKRGTKGEHAGKVYEIHYWQEVTSLSGKSTKPRHEWRPV
jgi:hypothetical protein